MPLGMASRVGTLRKSARPSGDELTELNAPRDHGQAGNITLSAALIEAFSDKYLHQNFDEPVPTAPCHREWWAMCTDKHPFVAIAAPRDHAKSTAVTFTYVLACVLFRVKRFVVIVSSTEGIAAEFLSTLAQELSENEEIQADFQLDRFVKDSETNLVVRFKDGWKFRIVAKGEEQRMRGLKWGQKRPDLMVFDDFEDDEQVESKERREKLSRWVLNAAIPAGKKGGCQYRMVGTVMHFDSFLENCLKDPTWLSKRFKGHKGFDDFTEILWPAKYDEAWFRDKRASYLARGNPDGYSQEYLNNPVSEQIAYFRRSDLIPYPEGFTPSIARPYLRVYVGWDFAVSKEERRDFTVGISVGVDERGMKYLLDVRRARWESIDIIEQMFLMELAWKPEFHAVEKGTIEKAIGPFLYREMARRGKYLTLYAITSSKDKRVRAKSWQAAIGAHHVHYDHNAEWFPVVQEEMIRFPKGEYDDCVDAQSIVGLLLEDIQDGFTDKEVQEQDDEEVREQRREALNSLGVGRNETTGY